MLQWRRRRFPSRREYSSRLVSKGEPAGSRRADASRRRRRPRPSMMARAPSKRLLLCALMARRLSPRLRISLRRSLGRFSPARCAKGLHCRWDDENYRAAAVSYTIIYARRCFHAFFIAVISFSNWPAFDMAGRQQGKHFLSFAFAFSAHDVEGLPEGRHASGYFKKCTKSR